MKIEFAETKSRRPSHLIPLLFVPIFVGAIIALSSWRGAEDDGGDQGVEDDEKEEGQEVKEAEICEEHCNVHRRLSGVFKVTYRDLGKILIKFGKFITLNCHQS